MTHIPDDIAGIFDHITPEAFHFTGSSVIDEATEACTLTDFIESHKLIVRAQFAAAGGNPNPVIWLSSPSRTCGFVATDDETMEDFAHRLAREAAALGATRLFFYRRTMVAAVPSHLPGADELKGEPIDDLAEVNADLLHEGIIWYAEERAGDERTHLSGILELADDERLVDNRMLSKQPIALLDPILAAAQG